MGTYLPPGRPAPRSAVEAIGEQRGRENASRRVAPGVWHVDTEAEESVIVSDRYEMAIFLVRFPSVGPIDQEEESDDDAYAFLSQRARGLNWKK
jgi:hypothetical protein